MASGNPRKGGKGENGQRPEERIKVVLNLNNPGGVKSQAVGASVFVTVDTSGSMVGPKLTQVVESVEDIIAKAPKGATFSIRAFSSEVKVLVARKKSQLDVKRAREGILGANLGGLTALYDAIGATIKEIPYAAFRTDRIYILIFTDGEENASKKETLESVMEQIRNVISKKKVIFTFIQAGTESRIVQELRVLEMTNPGKCNILNVEDSANGIKIAFEKAQKQMTTHLVEVELVGLGGLSNSLAGLKISTGRGQGGQVLASLPTRAVHQKPYKPRQETTGEGIAGLQRADLAQALASVTAASQPRTLWCPTQGASGVGSSKGPGLAGPHKQRSAQKGSSVPGKIHVANIPISFPVEGITNMFSQWGQCKLVANGGGNGGQWAVLSYKSKDCAEKAIKEGNNRIIQNQRIVVNSFTAK